MEIVKNILAYAILNQKSYLGYFQSLMFMLIIGFSFGSFFTSTWFPSWLWSGRNNQSNEDEEQDNEKTHLLAG